MHPEIVEVEGDELLTEQYRNVTSKVGMDLCFGSCEKVEALDLRIRLYFLEAFRRPILTEKGGVETTK